MYPKVIGDIKVMFYVLQIGLLNNLLFLRQCITCTTTRIPQDWCTVFITCSSLYMVTYQNASYGDNVINMIEGCLLLWGDPN